jgi:hypothetical protein
MHSRMRNCSACSDRQLFVYRNNSCPVQRRIADQVLSKIDDVFLKLHHIIIIIETSFEGSRQINSIIRLVRMLTDAQIPRSSSFA